VLILGLITRYSRSLREGLGLLEQRHDAPYNLGVPVPNYVINMLYPMSRNAGVEEGESTRDP